MKILISIILLYSYATAFTFDIWKSGTTLDEVIQISKSKNIPLHLKNYPFGKNFNPRFLYLNKYPDKRVFQYSDVLLGKKVLVSLFFTKKSKRLYKVKIHWMALGKDFKNTIYDVLKQKYGEGKVKIPSNIGSIIIGPSKKYWKPDQNTIIQFNEFVGNLDLLYNDLKETARDKKEGLEVKKVFKRKVIIKDGDKF